MRRANHPADELAADEVMIRGPTPGGLSDVGLYPNVVASIHHRFDCRDLPYRGVVHHGTVKDSSVIPHSETLDGGRSSASVIREAIAGMTKRPP
jgi:hypothetical protein